MNTQTRRRFIGTAALAGAAGLVGMPTARAAEPPLETTTVRLPRIPGICIAPQYVAEELLRAEGFTDIRYVDGPSGSTAAVASGKVDFDTNYASNFVQGIDRGEPITLLSGVSAESGAAAAARSPRALAGRAGSLCVKQVEKGAGRQDHRCVVALQSEQAGLVAGHEIVGLTGFGHCQQEIVGRVVGAPRCRQTGDRFGEGADLIDQPSRLRRPDQGADLRPPADGTQLLDQQGMHQQNELVLEPGAKSQPRSRSRLGYDKWREYEAKDTHRFYALRLHEGGMIWVESAVGRGSTFRVVLPVYVEPALEEAA